MDHQKRFDRLSGRLAILQDHVQQIALNLGTVEAIVELSPNDLTQQARVGAGHLLRMSLSANILTVAALFAHDKFEDDICFNQYHREFGENGFLAYCCSRDACKFEESTIRESTMLFTDEFRAAQSIYKTDLKRVRDKHLAHISELDAKQPTIDKILSVSRKSIYLTHLLTIVFENKDVDLSTLIESGQLNLRSLLRASFRKSHIGPHTPSRPD